MTKRTINLDVQEYLEECSTFLESLGERKWDGSAEEFQRLILNGLTLSMLWGNHECVIHDKRSLTYMLRYDSYIGISTLLRYANGRSVPHGDLQLIAIRHIVTWFRKTIAEAERKK